jgi:hypothetical protein
MLKFNRNNQSVCAMDTLFLNFKQNRLNLSMTGSKVVPVVNKLTTTP